MSVVGEWSRVFTVGAHVPPIVFLVKDEAGAPLPNYQFTLRAMAGVTSNGQFCVSSPDDEQLATLTTGPDGTATFTGWALGTRRGDKCLGVFPGTTQPQNTSDIGVWHFWVRLVPGAPAQSMTERGRAYTHWTLAPGVNTLTINVGGLSVTYTATGT